MSDDKGPKRAVATGLAAAAGAGALYLASVALEGPSWASICLLLAGRAVLGGAESFIITGAVAWGLASAGTPNAGKVIAWSGTAMFAAFAVGAPLGTALYSGGGFASVAAATALAPLAALALIAPVRGADPTHRGTASFLAVVDRIWLPGLAAALSSIGFGALITFGALLIEATGLVLMGATTSAAVATAGAALTGFGYALVFPGFGVEIVRRAPPESRGTAIGAYTACLDLALGIARPALGLVTGHAGLGAVFLAGAVPVACAAVVAFRLMHGPEPSGRWGPQPHDRTRER